MQRSDARFEMRCNACWRELEGRAISTTCGHLLCPEDASKILNNDAPCPICDQVLSRSLMKPVDINPNEEWINMAMAAMSPQIWQKELEMQYKMNKMVSQYRQKCEAMQEKFTEKLEQVYAAYQKMAKRCHLLEQENENLSRDKQELQEKFSEKSRQKRKLDEIYESLRGEYESMKRAAIQPANKFFSRGEPGMFASLADVMDNREPLRQGLPAFTDEIPGHREDIWPQPRTKSSPSGPFDVSPRNVQPAIGETTKRRAAYPAFGGETTNPTTTLRNLILSPVKRPQSSRNRSNIFTL